MFSSPRIRPTPTERVRFLSVTAATALALAFPRWTPGSPEPARIVPNPSPIAPLVDGLVTHDLATGGETPESLVLALAGSDATVTNVRFTGAPIAAGTFSGGTGIVGFESGIVLGSGNIATVLGPQNMGDGAGTDPGNGLPGDPDLEALIPPSAWYTLDATVLEFDLECAAGTAISFQYVFSSDEYEEGWPSSIDDVFACFVNGQNVALIPGTNDPITIQTVNGSQHRAFHRTNDCSTLGLGFPCSHIATEMDGLTVVLSAIGTLQPGVNHVKLAIADSYDDVVDSNVFIRGQSLVCSPGPPVFETPSSCNLILKGWAGAPFIFDIDAWAVTGLPGESVTLGVTGDTVPLAGGTFVPPLPTGPAQPVSTQFQWTPTLADLGLYHLDFTATDQLQQSVVLDVPIEISIAGTPAFEAPSPCGQILDAFAGAPFSFGITAAAWTSAECGVDGAPGQSVTLSVTGDATPLAGGIFVPPLPAGPAQPVSSQFHWTPTLADAGLYHLHFTATDQLQQSGSCEVTIRVLASPGIDLCQAGVGGVRDCPCSNPPTHSPGGCDNSSGTGGARLDSLGRPSISNPAVMLTTTGENPTAFSLVMQGNTLLSTGVIYGQGIRCVGGLMKRLYMANAYGGSITVPGDNNIPIPYRSAQLGDPITPGTSRYYAVYYRDPTVLGGCPATSTFNATQTQEILWYP